MTQRMKDLSITGKINVVCVKWGDKYTSEHVNRLHYMVSKNLTIPFNFICFTDNSAGLNCKTVPIEHYDLEGVWNKLLLFKRGMLDGVCLYLDLDVIIQNNIDLLFNSLSNKLTLIKCYWAEQKIHDTSSLDRRQRHMTNINSSVMLWHSDNVSNIWDHFWKDCDWYMINYLGIDRFLTHEQFNMSYFPQGLIYSRLFGYGSEEGQYGPRFITEDTFDLFYKPEQLICIFNSYGPVKNPYEGIHLDDTDYEPFKVYYEQDKHIL
jgi:hypothetical protein